MKNGTLSTDKVVRRVFLRISTCKTNWLTMEDNNKSRIMARRKIMTIIFR